MLSIKKILVPTDFSEGSLHSIQYAVEFADKFDAQILLLHVLEIPPGLTTEAVIHPNPDEKMLTLQEYLDQISKKKFDQLQDYLKSRNVDASSHTATGVPHEAIVQVAQENDVDMIVMGTHGRTGLKHFFMGSTAERVIRYATCPVTTTRISNDDKVTEEQLLLLVESEG